MSLTLLDNMEEHYVIPEDTTNALLLRRFGRASPAVQKCRRMAFWMRRFAFQNPFEVEDVPEDPLERSRMLLQRIAGKTSAVEEIGDGPVLLTAQSPLQSEQLQKWCSDPSAELYIDGPWRTC
jgi:hypothetical protein